MAHDTGITGCAPHRRRRPFATLAALAWALAACAPTGVPAEVDADRGDASASVAAAGSSPGAPPAGDPRSAHDTAVPSPAGTYVRAGRSVAHLALTPEGDEWQIRLQAGGDPADGAGIAADCEVHARGPLRGGRIDAAVVPFESATLSVSQADLQASPASVRVVLDGDAVQVETDFRGCALGVDLGGRFLREP